MSNDYWLNELRLLIEPFLSALPTILAAIVLFWILCGIVGSSINKYKGGGPFIGFLAGLLFGPLGVALTMIAPYKPSVLINASPQRRQWFSDQMKANTDPEREELRRKLDERIK